MQEPKVTVTHWEEFFNQLKTAPTQESDDLIHFLNNTSEKQPKKTLRGNFEFNPTCLVVLGVSWDSEWNKWSVRTVVSINFELHCLKQMNLGHNGGLHSPFCLRILARPASGVSGEVALEPSSTTWICAEMNKKGCDHDSMWHNNNPAPKPFEALGKIRLNGRYQCLGVIIEYKQSSHCHVQIISTSQNIYSHQPGTVWQISHGFLRRWSSASPARCHRSCLWPHSVWLPPISQRQTGWRQCRQQYPAGPSLSPPLRCRSRSDDKSDGESLNTCKLSAYFASFLIYVFGGRGGQPTFGGLPLSTVPALLILLISGLVSWRIWGIQEGENVRK